MGRRVDVDDLVGATDIAARLDLASGSLVHDWRARYDDFPAPIARVGTVVVWAWPDVEKWAKQTGRIK
jgi:hypothetical protein